VHVVDRHTSSSEKLGVGVTRSGVATDKQARFSCSYRVVVLTNGKQWRWIVFGCCCRWMLLSLYAPPAAAATAAATDIPSCGECQLKAKNLGLPGQPGLVIIASVK
jgi:hypothetical protein